jgi:DNA-binding transcriptional LysR family regulator
MDRIAGMEAFVALVEMGSFHNAAKQLGLSRALVSKRVAALERDLGAQLVHRTTRRLAITGPGAAFLERCRWILAEYQVATAELAQHQLEPTGLLRINGPMSFGQLHLTPAVIDFMARYPGIEIQLTLTDRFVDVIEEGYDLVVRIGALRDSSLVARASELRHQPGLLVLGEGPRDLAHHDLGRVVGAGQVLARGGQHPHATDLHRQHA